MRYIAREKEILTIIMISEYQTVSLRRAELNMLVNLTEFVAKSPDGVYQWNRFDKRFIDFVA